MSFMRTPAFQFYPSDWLGSRSVRLMDAEQRGWYIQLLAESWESDTQATLPNDDALLRVLAGMNTRSTGVDERWEFVKKQFKKRGQIVYNERLMDEVAKQEENREKKRKAGEASAEARRAKREDIKTQHLNSNGARQQKSTRVEKRSPSVPTEGQQNPTLQSSSSISSSASTSNKKEPPAHAELMDFLASQNGPIPNPGQQGKAVKWLLAHSYTPDECRECFLALAAQEWRKTPTTWVTVEKEIGAGVWRGNGRSTVGVNTAPDDPVYIPTDEEIRRDLGYHGPEQ